MINTLSDHGHIIRRLLLAFVLLVANGWAPQLQAKCSADTDSKQILVLGDSLSAGYGLADTDNGWVALLNQQLAPQKLALINASISGDTSAGGLARLPALLNKYQPQLVLIELGGNDGLRGYSLANLRNQLRQLIILSKQHNADVLLLEMLIPPNYGKRYTEKFRALYSELAAEQQIPLVPFFLHEVALADTLMQGDGIHPNAAAQPLLRDHVAPFILRWAEKKCAKP